MRSRRLPLALLAAVALSLALPGCAPESSAHPGTPSTPPASSTPAPPDPDQQRAQRAEQMVAAMSLRDRVASVIMGAAPGTEAAALHDYVANNHLGGFILMGGNIPSDAEALRALTGRIAGDPAFPTLIAVDQEGGEVSRLPWDTNPGADQLKFEPVKQTEKAFHARAELLVQSGINVNFGVVADVPSGPNSFIYGRALGTTPGASAKRVAAAVDGEQLVAEQHGSGQRHGMVASTLKHFPGHGAAEGDSHVGVPSTSISFAEWQQTHAKPFEAGIAAGAELLMFGHL
ncbi:MAG: glycoside hydrolase family 3 protein, partial [Actinobacteria bacterium]|nr:glycoside hydrolase family 3 protein [Actinomycetota bacterium]